MKGRLLAAAALGTMCLGVNLSAGAASAGRRLMEAEDAYRNGRYAEAFGPFVAAAAEGDVHAEYRLGEMYALGHGVKRDLSRAISWYARAAARGDLDAENNLGAVYYDERDYARALEWFSKAARAGNAGGQFNMGNLYYNGEGVPLDLAAAARWYRKAAEGGHPLAQDNIGLMCAEGRGVPYDPVEAYKWYRLASERGDKSAAASLKALGSRMTSAQVAEGESRAARTLGPKSPVPPSSRRPR